MQSAMAAPVAASGAAADTVAAEGNAPAPTPEPAAPGTPPIAVSAGTGSVADRFVAAHATARARHCAAPLTWSDNLAAYAQQWADHLASAGCAFGHSGGKYGENLAAGTQGVLDPEATVRMWYDEVKQYDFAHGGFSMQTGHFTQLVWRVTQRLGCGHSVCNGNDIWVCEYDPPGNFDGEYAANVLAEGCKARR
jgi:uncharacterized protein YkwD